MAQRGRGAYHPSTSAHRGKTALSSCNAAMYTGKINFDAIGQKLRAERERLGQTQEQVAEVIGITPAFVGHIERAERSMSLNTLINFCNFYHVTIDYLLSDTLPPNHDNALTQIADILQYKSPEQQAAILDILRAVTRHL